MDSTNSPQSLEQSGAIGGTTAGPQHAAFDGQPVAEQALRAYHGDPAVKAKYIARMRAHQKADELIHDMYWKNGKGGAIGCTVHSNDRTAYETDLGMPEWFASLEDMIFENLSEAASFRFPMRLLSAIPVGFAEWDRLYHKFCAYVLRDICRFDRTVFPDVAAAVDDIVRLHEQMTESDDQAWSAALLAAKLAARSAAGSASRSAQSAAFAAEESAESAALLAALAADESAAYDRMADWLVRKFAASSGSD